MNKLVMRAHVVTPNPTEAALLLQKQPRDYGIGEDGTVTVEKACELINDLAMVYPKTLPIVKSVASENRIGVCIRFTKNNTADIKKSVTKILLGTRTPAPSVGGTGDLFSSLLVARWLQNKLNNQSNQHDKTVVIESVIKTMSKVMKSIQRENMSDLPFRKLLHVV